MGDAADGASTTSPKTNRKVTIEDLSATEVVNANGGYANRGRGKNASQPLHDVSLPYNEYQTLCRLRHKGETEQDVLITAIRWLDAIDALSKNCHSRKDRFSLEELNKMTGSRYQMLRAGYDEDTAQTIMKALFCEQHEYDIREAFEILDTDKSGAISKDELRAALPLMGEKRAAKGIDELFELVDTDGTGFIEFEEFCTLVKGMNPKDLDGDFSSTIANFLNGATTGVGALLSGEPGDSDGEVYDGSTGWWASTTEAAAELGGGASMALSAFSAGASLNVSTYNMGSAGKANNRMKEAGASDSQAKALCEAYFSDEHSEDLLRKAFKRLDVDGNYQLDKAELKNLMILLDEEISDAKIDELFEAADEDNSGMLSFEEFSQTMKGMREDSQAREAEASSNLADAGGWFSGFFT